MTQTSLFTDEVHAGVSPLADRMRPQDLDGFVGQRHLVGRGKIIRNMIEQDRVASMILWGPPGVGKTTLASIIAKHTAAEFVDFSAVTGGMADIKNIMAEAEVRRCKGRRTILFVDEIHRFNKTQQDAFLPYVEKGTVTLIGATTENPSFELNSALLSRCKVFVLGGLDTDDLVDLLKRAADKGFPGKNVHVPDDVLHTIAEYANGDARTALNTLEAAVEFSPEADGVTEVPEDILDGNIGRRSVLYDKHGEEHYNIIAAFHEGMRNSDPDAALYWLARMLDGGEDPGYIARRFIEAAAETVGLADNTALRMATSCYYACQELGEHECRTILAETAIYMSLAPRTNGVPMALGRAFWDVHHNPAEPVPMQIRNAPTKLMKQLDYGKGYQYAEDADEKMTKMQCLPDSLKDRRYYEPGPKGDERFYRRRLDAIRDWRSGKRENPPRRRARSFFKALRTRGSSRQLWPL